MEVKTRIMWLLLLALGCLVHSVRPDDPASVSTTIKGTEAPVGITGISVTSGAMPTTTKLLTAALTMGPATVKMNGTTATSSTGTSQTTIATPTTTTTTATPFTTVKPTSKAPTPTTKIAAPLSGPSTVVPSLTSTVSKPEGSPTIVGGAKSLAPSTVIVSVSGSTASQTIGSSITQSPDQTTSLKPTTVTVTKNPGDVGTIRDTAATTAAPTVKKTLVNFTDSTTTTQESNKATGTTAVVTKKTSPGQGLGTSGSTAPSRSPQTPFKDLTVTTEGQRTGPDMVPKSTAGTTVTPQTTVSQTMVPQTTTEAAPATAAPVPRIFTYSLNKGHQSEEEKEMVTLCQQLMRNLEDGNCTLRHHNGKVDFDSVEINGKVKTNLVIQHYEDITKKPTDNRTLITILASCGALLIMIIILAVCASHHRKPCNENLQHLTEELQTVENGYHDNPTLEVMEVQPEMQEKKLALNGEFNDSWIVPIDNLLKEDVLDEEDTHL